MTTDCAFNESSVLPKIAARSFVAIMAVTGSDCAKVLSFNVFTKELIEEASWQTSSYLYKHLIDAIHAQSYLTNTSPYLFPAGNALRMECSKSVKSTQEVNTNPDDLDPVMFACVNPRRFASQIQRSEFGHTPGF